MGGQLILVQEPPDVGVAGRVDVDRERRLGVIADIVKGVVDEEGRFFGHPLTQTGLIGPWLILALGNLFLFLHQQIETILIGLPLHDRLRIEGSQFFASLGRLSGERG